MAEEYAGLTQELIQQMNARADEKCKKMMKQNQELMEQNSKLLEAITKSAGAGHGATNGEATSRPAQSGDKPKHKCRHSNRFMYHREENCLELESNTHKRSTKWKSALPS